MTRAPLLAAIAIGATLIIAPSANAMPLRLAAESHATAPRCVHNGAATNHARHANCGLHHPTATTSTAGDNPAPTTTTATGDQGTSSGDQGDQTDQAGSSSDQGSSSDDQGDQGSSSGDQGGSGD